MELSQSLDKILSEKSMYWLCYFGYYQTFFRKKKMSINIPIIFKL